MSKYSTTKKIWSKWYQKSNYAKDTNAPKHIRTSKYLVDAYGQKIRKCDIFCELGVGSGRNLYYFHQKYPNVKYIGNDINPDIKNQIKSIYPDLLNWASIEVIDTLSFLKKDDFATDVLFTHGHLMHLPDEIIHNVTKLISEKTKKYILLFEAYLNSNGAPLIKKIKYKRYRFDRDYEGMFNGFDLKEKKISLHPKKRWVRECLYFFEKKD